LTADDGTIIATTAMEIKPSSCSTLDMEADGDHSVFEPHPMQSEINVVAGHDDDEISATVENHGDKGRQTTHVSPPSCLIALYFSLILFNHA
jgi:hypothetical protein